MRFDILFSRFLVPLYPPLMAALPTDPRVDHKTIVLADDDQTTVTLLKKILERSGYRVFPAGDGEEALRICREHESEIDLLVIDVIMPKMSGTALAKQVHTFRPDLPVLFISGVLAEEIVLSQQPRPKEAYLPKPITNEQLLGITRRLLAAHPA